MAITALIQPPAKILIVGESVYKIHTHFKGFASYETGYASLGLDNFISRFADSGLEITFMPNQEVSHRFPSSIEAMQKYDAIVISDAPADSFLGFAYAALLICDDLAAQGVCMRLGPARSAAGWVKWLARRAP